MKKVTWFDVIKFIIFIACMEIITLFGVYLRFTGKLY